MVQSSSKRAKTTPVPTVTPDGADLGSVSAQAQSFIPFQTGPSLERIPDDVLLEILSHLPILDDRDVEFALVRTPALRALSQTSRVLRSRCLAMAWRSVEFGGVLFPKRKVVFFRAIAEATMIAVRVLKASPHLLPLIQFVHAMHERFSTSDSRLGRRPSL